MGRTMNMITTTTANMVAGSIMVDGKLAEDNTK